MSRQGIFITFEGGEGSGKSTQIHALKRFLDELGRDVLLVREPGGTKVGEGIRAILLDPANEGLAPEAELLLYEAARAQITDEVIKPALDAGKVVLCDRFYDSTLAYQGFGRGIALDTIGRLNDLAVCGCHPERTILLDIAPETGLRRATMSGPDRLEQEGEDFHRRVREGFLRIAAADSARVRLINADADVVDCACEVFENIADLFDDIDPAYVRSVYESDPLLYFGEVL